MAIKRINKGMMGYSLIGLAIVIGLVTRLIAVFQYVTFDIGPDPDQIRDSFIIMKMWEGSLPTLGPSSSIGGYHILPLYYYLFFPFSILGADPTFQAFPNALFSFLSIPLFIYVTYQLLEKTEFQTRIFLSGLAGFWYSILYGEIFISNFQWNPSSIPFFVMILSLLYKAQMERKFSYVMQVLLWAIYGVVLAITISLHSSTLFVMPVVFIITSGMFVYETLKRKEGLASLLLPGISVVSATIALLPYWIGEFGRGFQNTKMILKTILSSGRKSDGNLLTSIYTKISNLFINYLNLVKQAYFWDSSLIYLILSILFLSLVTWWGFSKFRGNRHIWLMWCSTWAIFLLAAANLDSEGSPFYYKLLILFAPIALTISSLAYLDIAENQKQIFAAFIGVIVLLSTYHNGFHDYRFLMSKYGPDRLLSTGDVAQILNQLPPGSTLCDPRIKRKREINNQYNYINTYLTRKELTITETCKAGNFVIHPKQNMLISSNFLNKGNYEEPYFVKIIPSPEINLFPTFTIAKNEPIARPAELFLEINPAYVYRLK